MPYNGLDESQTAWMDKCVTSVMGDWEKNHKMGDMTHENRKSRAIAICRATLNKTKGNAAIAQVVLDRGLIEEFNSLIEEK
jgi:hypothetical protein